jgi:peptidoglycan hydrolase CwlO-like protein
LVAAVLVVAISAALLTATPRSEATPDLGDVRAKQDDVRAQLDQQNAAIDSILAEAGRLKQQQDKVAADLAREEAKLAHARSELANAEHTLKVTKRRLKSARASLSRLLVSIYQSGAIDETTVLLDSDGLDDFVTRSRYLNMINEHQAGVAQRVHDLQITQAAQVEASKNAVGRIEDAKGAIEARRDSLAASRADLDARKADLRAARAAQQEELSKLVGKEKDLVEALSTPAPDGSSSNPSDSGDAPAAPVAAPSGSQATLNSDGTANAPADAPQAVKDVIAAANQITNTPYVYGGGHGSFESSGYDCSGSVSFALHGGGFLDAPLDSTGFESWGDAGPGNWITVYANAGHAYMEVAGLRYDTSGAPPRWQTDPPYPAGFVVRHPPGY